MTIGSNESGFALVEAIAALALAAIAATALMTALNASSVRSAEAGVRSLALREAELLMLEMTDTAEPETLKLRGALPNSSIAWSRSLKSAGPAYPGLQHIVVEVSWHGVRKGGKTRLEAYRIAPDRER